VDPEQDFIGHVGGDDFIVLFQSEDWEARCTAILAAFRDCVQVHLSEEHRNSGGYMSEDRRGNQVFHPLLSLSLGVVKVEAGQFHSHHQIATAAADAKKQSKKIAGNSLFVERRAIGAVEVTETANSADAADPAKAAEPAAVTTEPAW